MVADRLRTVAALGTAQTIAWASSYYLPAILAAPIARDVGVSGPTVFAAFSVALLVSAVLGPLAGRAIDRWGGRPVLMGTNVVFAVGLVALSVAEGATGLFAAWVVLGIGMGSGLYEAAFSALVRLYGTGARSSITGITLIAGFASTVGWPLSTVLEAQFGWRGACLAWAAVHLFLGIPLNALIASTSRGSGLFESKPATTDKSAAIAPPVSRRAAIVLAFVFASTWFISTAMAAHLPQLLQASGATLAAAVTAGALIGPAQVAARMLEYGLLRRFHPLLTARVATLMHPLAAVALTVVGAPAAAVFALLHGAGNGILTITNGTLPLVLFGSAGYGGRQGRLMVPARIMQALAPWLFGLCLYRWGAGALWVSASLALVAFTALCLLSRAGTAATQSSTRGNLEERR
jgi:predicted MFS family arabinose efflux permease